MHKDNDDKDIRPKDSGVKILKRGLAMQLLIRYIDEEGPGAIPIDDAIITLYENGIIFFKTKEESGTVHLSNCEIMWRFKPWSPPIPEMPKDANGNEIPLPSNVIPFMTRAEREYLKRNPMPIPPPQPPTDSPDGAA